MLDIASLEGHFSFEFAARGANVLGVEGRQTNVDIALAEKRRLGLSSVEFVRDDVRNLSREKYGTFDCVLCLGILYHLEAKDAARLVSQISEVCPDGLAVIDTHFAGAFEAGVSVDGSDYAGRFYTEYESEPSEEVTEQSVWSSIGNTKSFWFTRPSLYNMIERAGFTSVYECHAPYVSDYPPDRVTLVAVKGRPERLLNAENPEARAWPELRPTAAPHPLRARLHHLKRVLTG